MKRTVWFLTIFVLVLAVLYMEPVFFPPASQSSVTENNQKPREKISSLSYDEIPAAGLSAFINKSEDSIKESLGEPVSTQNTGLGYMTNIYEDKVRELFIEANVKDNIVQSIKVAGKSTDKIAPFHFGMSLTELTDITTLFPNFSFDYNDAKVDIELSEEDMNYRPLIAFDNDTFAILFFGQENNELYAVDYVNEDALLRLMPYQLNSDETFAYTLEDLPDEKWLEINEGNVARAKGLISYLRKIEGYDTYLHSDTLRYDADSLLLQLTEEPESVLEESSLEDWENADTESGDASAVLIKTDDVKNANDYDSKQEILLATKPVVDVSYAVFQWYSDPYIHSRFISDKPQALEIAFSKENMVVLIQEVNNETEDSDQN